MVHKSNAGLLKLETYHKSFRVKQDGNKDWRTYNQNSRLNCEMRDIRRYIASLKNPEHDHEVIWTVSC